MIASPLRRVHGLLGALLAVGSLAAQSTPAPPVTGFLAKTLHHDGVDRHYVVYLPREYRADAKWPLLVFLNGMGECGTDGWKHVDVGLGPAIRAEAERWPFVVLFPQKPDKPSQWIDHDAMVLAMVAATEREYAIDGKRRLLTGLSQGGAGTWAIGGAHREMWAALAPVCGYGKPAAIAPNVKDLPIWAFHGEADHVVPMAESQRIVDAVREAGGAPQLTLYPGVAHNSWDKAYRESSLAEWLRLVLVDAVSADLLCHATTRRAAEVSVILPASKDGPASEASLHWHASGDEPVLRLSFRHGADAPRERTLAAADGELAAVLASALHDPLQALVRTGHFATTRGNIREPALVIELRGERGTVVHRCAMPTGRAAAALRAWLQAIRTAVR